MNKKIIGIIITCFMFFVLTYTVQGSFDSDLIHQMLDEFFISTLIRDENLFASKIAPEGPLVITFEGDEYVFDSKEDYMRELYGHYIKNEFNNREINVEPDGLVVSGMWVWGELFWDEYEEMVSEARFHLIERNGSWFIQKIELTSLDIQYVDIPVYPGTLISHSNDYYKFSYPAAWEMTEEASEVTLVSPHILRTSIYPSGSWIQYIDVYVYEKDFDTLDEKVNDELYWFDMILNDFKLISQNELQISGNQGMRLWISYIDLGGNPTEELIFYTENEHNFITSKSILKTDGQDIPADILDAMMDTFELIL